MMNLLADYYDAQGHLRTGKIIESLPERLAVIVAHLGGVYVDVKIGNIRTFTGCKMGCLKVCFRPNLKKDKGEKKSG